MSSRGYGNRYRHDRYETPYERERRERLDSFDITKEHPWLCIFAAYGVLTLAYHTLNAVFVLLGC